MVVPATLGLVACGTTDQASKETLPPIRTTTSTSAPATTTIPEGTRFYVIKRGDTLAAIAASFSVTVQSIVDLNGLENADAIQAGQTLELIGILMLGFLVMNNIIAFTLNRVNKALALKGTQLRV